MALTAAQVQRGGNCALASGKNPNTIGIIAEFPAAIASAFADAIGKPIRNFPVTPEDVHAALDNADN